MRTFWASLTLGLLALGNLFAEFNQPITIYNIGFGYRQDGFRWGFDRREGDSSSSSFNHRFIFNDDSSSEDHDPLFKQRWKTLRIAEVTGYYSYTTCNNYYFRINGGWGTIQHGRVKSKAFTNLRDPEEETSEINGDAGQGDVSDLEVCVGYQFTSNGSRVVVTPVIGYSWHNQHLKMRDADQEKNRFDTPPRIGKIDHLSFEYKPHWYGPFFGLEFMVLVENPCFLVWGGAEWHWSVKYRSSGKWQLHDHVFHDAFDARFHDSSMGHGLYSWLGLDYRLGCGWYIGVIGYYRHFQTHNGRHEMKSLFTDVPRRRDNFGTLPVIGVDDDTRMESARWTSWSAALTFTFRYYDP